tara:strand:+ start:257 stop:712 length:456 start_codon:yes stop_codon:yes gene_type:complete
VGCNGPTLLQGELKMVQYVKKLFDGDRKAVFSFTAKIASTTAETYNVDASALNARNDGTACTYVDINKMWWSVNNTAVTKPLLLEWVNSGTNPIAWSCNYAEDQDFSSVGGLLNTKASNYTGDVLINFSSVTDNDTASITVEFLKRYSSIS